ncbi:MAG: aminotransferase class IV family protein [Rhizobiaceae bacterium]|nr:aminotransferase class IV family protein [Rhizobiaceae bacterium]
MSAEGAIRDGTPSGFYLIETLGYQPGQGAIRRDLHRSRLVRSARELGFPLEPHKFDSTVDRLAAGERPLRLRVTLDASGQLEAKAAAFVPLPPDAVWRVAIAATRIDSGNAMIEHKISAREIYEKARAEFPASEIDEVILLNERGEVCEGTITNVFLHTGDAALATPALACGLLPGVLRGHMIRKGQAREAILTSGDLRKASMIKMGNSLRGLIRARLV